MVRGGMEDAWGAFSHAVSFFPLDPFSSSLSPPCEGIIMGKTNN